MNDLELTMPGYTHAQLVLRAARWLGAKENCRLVLRETNALTGECPDAIGWKYGFQSRMVEVKVSRSDFLADRKKPFRIKPGKGVGLMRWMMAPRGLITVDDLVTMPGWGLLEVNGRCVRETLRATPQREVNRNAEVSILVQAAANAQLCASRDLNDWFADPTSAVGAMRVQRRAIGEAERQRERETTCTGEWAGPGKGWNSCDVRVAPGFSRCSDHGGRSRREKRRQSEVQIAYEARKTLVSA